jgi:uridylate kinase
MKYVISLGGSIISPAPGQIDVSFIKRFVALVAREVKKGHRFFVVAGGGATARQYIAAARRLGKVSNFDLDWMGISATKLNAQLLTSAFGELARKGIINDPLETKQKLSRVNVVSGWKPGWSTDFVSVKIAQTYSVKTVINLSNIDYVYTSDPRKNPRARKIKQMTWREFRRKFGARWEPGANVPFDPVGAKLAESCEINVFVMNGRNLKNFAAALEGKKFQGTVLG